jgi:glycine hydroxymethyltransferase
VAEPVGRLTDAAELAPALRRSAARQAEVLRTSLVLNPVENFPFPDDVAVAAGPLHGLYNSDKNRARNARAATDHQFAGRQAIEQDCVRAYAAWARALGAADASLRVLSGLHSHTVLFMSVSRPAQRVLLLPVEAGGHLSGRQILERLGLDVVDMVVDREGLRVDVERTLALCDSQPVDFVFVDRSEGLVIEDFSALTHLDAVSVYDASQHLANVLVGDHPNPFGDGFDLLVSSVHKNFPGPQKALLATRAADPVWRQLLEGLSTYVSNMHVASTYAATLTLGRSDWLATYSKRMLACAPLLEQHLADNGVPVVRRPADAVPTHHVWIREGERERAFETFEALEQCGLHTNFRLLPYGLGHGVRLGLSAAVRLGLLEEDVPRLAALIADIRRQGPRPLLRSAARAFCEGIWEREAAS